MSVQVDPMAASMVAAALSGTYPTLLPQWCLPPREAPLVGVQAHQDNSAAVDQPLDLSAKPRNSQVSLRPLVFYRACGNTHSFSTSLSFSLTLSHYISLFLSSFFCVLFIMLTRITSRIFISRFVNRWTEDYTTKRSCLNSRTLFDRSLRYGHLILMEDRCFIYC